MKQVYPTVSPALHFLKPEFHHQQMVEIEFSLRFPGASATIKFHQMPTKSAPGRLVYGRTDTWKTKALTNHPITSYHILSHPITKRDLLNVISRDSVCIPSKTTNQRIVPHFGGAQEKQHVENFSRCRCIFCLNQTFFRSACLHCDESYNVREKT